MRRFASDQTYTSSKPPRSNSDELHDTRNTRSVVVNFSVTVVPVSPDHSFNTTHSAS